MTVRQISLCAVLVLQVLQGAVWAQSSSEWVVGGASGVGWAEVVDRWIALSDSVRAGSVQPREISPGSNVLRGLVRATGVASQVNIFDYPWAFSKDPDRLEMDNQLVGWNPRMWGGSLAEMRGLVDGDELSAAFEHPPTLDGRPNATVFFTLDLGVPLALDSLSFFPPQSGFTTDNRRQRNVFPVAYEVTRTNTPVDWLIFKDEAVALGSPGYHPLEEVIASTFSNNQSIVSLRFPRRFTRFLRFRFGGVITLGVVAEFQAFGRGYPQVARYISQVKSFAEPVSLGRIKWHFTRYRQTESGQIVEAPNAPVSLLIETRSGTDADPVDHFIFDELGQPLSVDRATYEDAPPVDNVIEERAPGFQARREDDTEDWTPWSIPYVQSGVEIQSADGGEFFQFRFEIATEDPFAFGVLDSVAFELSPLLADSVLAEVSLAGVDVDPLRLTQVPLGVDTTFVYDIRTVFTSATRVGFDGIELDVPPSAHFLSLEVDGVVMEEGVDFTLNTTPNRFAFTFPEPFVENVSFRVRYRGAIYQASLFLDGQLVNGDPQARLLPQSIEAGDAREDVVSNSVQVVGRDSSQGILSALRLSSPALTPNGDDTNDAVAIQFDLFSVEGARVLVGVYDLSGRRVTTLLSSTVNAGSHTSNWDGKAEDGRVVAPGFYLARVEVDTDLGVVVQTHAVAVAY